MPSDKDEENQTSSDDQLVSPVPGYNMSPIRPQGPDADRQPILPSVPRPSRPEIPTRDDPTPTEEIDLANPSQEQAAVAALERLRQKMAAVAKEYAAGKLNRAQFHAIYQRYQEQRDITERLLTRDPKTGAWQTVVQPGLTGFLREHFEAKVESYAIYDIDSGRQIIRTGTLQLPREQAVTIMKKLKVVIQERGNPGMARRRIGNDRYIVIAPGSYTVAIVVFSLEPAIAQLEMIKDMHRDFELANRQVLSEQRLDPGEMVFPHRALFEH